MGLHMAQRRGLRGQPRSCLAPNAVWPEGPWVENVPGAVVDAAYVSREIMDWLTETGTSKEALAKASDISSGTLSNITTGKVYIDLPTLSKLERATKRCLWPPRPKTWRRQR